MPKPATQPTTAQSLGALLKSARDIMRNDKGLNGDLLEKYATDGELQFTLPDVLQIPSITRHANVNEIICKFGGADQLRNAANQLQTLLYAA